MIEACDRLCEPSNRKDLGSSCWCGNATADGRPASTSGGEDGSKDQHKDRGSKLGPELGSIQVLELGSRQEPELGSTWVLDSKQAREPGSKDPGSRQQHGRNQTSPGLRLPWKPHQQIPLPGPPTLPKPTGSSIGSSFITPS
jgi:hypothetical protein